MSTMIYDLVFNGLKLKLIPKKRWAFIIHRNLNTQPESSNIKDVGTIQKEYLPPHKKKLNELDMINKVRGESMNTSILNLFKHSLTLTILSYGSWYILIESLTSIIPVGIIVAIVATATLHYLSVPAPNSKAVEAIFGKDLVNVDLASTEYVVRTVAHRGAGLDVPENTLAAFKMCKEKGCDVIEFDVALTADGVPVVFHDNSLERMADSKLIINDTEWKDLSDINISIKHPFKERYPQTNIPTLDQTVNELLASGQRMFIDIKDNDTKMVKVVVDLFAKYPELYTKAAVTTFFPNIIYLIRRKNPKVVCSLGWRPLAFSYDSYSYSQGPGPRRGHTWYQHFALSSLDVIHEWLLTRITYRLLGISLVLLHKDSIGPKTVLDWRAKGVRVMAWTANTPAEKQYLAKVLKITYLTDTLTGEGTTHSGTS